MPAPIVPAPSTVTFRIAKLASPVEKFLKQEFPNFDPFFPATITCFKILEVILKRKCMLCYAQYYKKYYCIHKLKKSQSGSSDHIAPSHILCNILTFLLT